MSRYNTLYRDRRRSKVTIRPGTRTCDTTTVRHDTALGVATRAWPWCWVCRDTACDKAGQACDTAGQACDTAGQACDTAELGHDTAGEGATTRAITRLDTAQGAACARPGLGCAPCAPNPVLF